MIIEKRDKKIFYFYCYKLNRNRFRKHGLWYSHKGYGIGYYYHDIIKGFWLRNKIWL